MSKGKRRQQAKHAHTNKYSQFSKADRVRTEMDSQQYRDRQARESVEARRKEEERRRAGYGYGRTGGYFPIRRISPLELLDGGLDEILYS